METNHRILNILLAGLCIVLLLVMGFFLFNNRREQAAEKEHLEKIQAEIQESKSSTTDSEIQKTEEVQAGTEGQESLASEPEEEKVMGISCWGDEFLVGDDIETNSYPAVLQNLLNENGYSITVQNKSINGGSTLSLMKKAGIGDDVLQGYIDKHQEAAGGEASVYETGIRDFSEEELVREDKDFIPVLFMGYYGGWNYDANELAEQQQKILDTFEKNKDKFLIIGLAPSDGSVDQAAYDTVMREKWGEHYTSAQEAAGGNVIASYEGQNSIAQTIYQKLTERNYIEK